MTHIIICRYRENCLICGGDLIHGESWEIEANGRYFTHGLDSVCSKCGRKHSLETAHYAVDEWGEYDEDYEDTRWGWEE